MRPLTIAIDWDGTISADPQTFHKVAALFAAAGHHVVVCTGRAFPPTGPEGGELIVPTYCTAGQAKAEYMREQGVHVDIWIDDDPLSITHRDPRLT